MAQFKVDQTLAWIFATVLAGGLFGAIYLGTRSAARHIEGDEKMSMKIEDESAGEAKGHGEETEGKSEEKSADKMESKHHEEGHHDKAGEAAEEKHESKHEEAGEHAESPAHAVKGEHSEAAEHEGASHTKHLEASPPPKHEKAEGEKHGK